MACHLQSDRFVTLKWYRMHFGDTITPMLFHRMLLRLALVMGVSACATGMESEGLAPAPDATDLPVDAMSVALDAAISIDASLVPDASSVTATAGYLDRCTENSQCIEGLCLDDVGQTQFCSKSCIADSQCADEHFCIDQQCVPDDTGTLCQVETPTTCSTGLCQGFVGGFASCTKECSSAAQCPAGYSCSATDTSVIRTCIDVEKPCEDAVGNPQCGSGLCDSFLGACTAMCTNASDCPGGYNCTNGFCSPFECTSGLQCPVGYGCYSNLCISESSQIRYFRANGSACGLHSDCASGYCNSDGALGPICTAGCTSVGGCAGGLACRPIVVGVDIVLACEISGSRDLGETCTSGTQCHSSVCDASMVCSRLCNDGYCPSDMSCQTVAGTSIGICRP